MVRAASEAVGRARLRDAMKAQELPWPDADRSDSTAASAYAKSKPNRIVIVCGDLASSDERLGMRDDSILPCLTAIIHNGANVNHALPYSSLRAANVQSTLNVLRVACRAGAARGLPAPIPLCYVSSVSALDQRTGSALSADMITRTNGYSQTKWISERLIEACATGRFAGSGLTPCAVVPALIIRPGAVSGHSVTGCSAPTDYVNRLLRGITRLRSVPRDFCTERVDFVPVDFCCTGTVTLFNAFLTEPKSFTPAQSFALTNPVQPRWSEIVDWINTQSGGRFGPIKLRPNHSDWLADLDTDRTNPLLPFRLLLRTHISPTNTWIDRDTHSRIRELTADRLQCPPANARLLLVYLNRWAADGLLSPAPSATK